MKMELWFGAVKNKDQRGVEAAVIEIKMYT